ncbi:Hypothetical protein PHPALM_2485 [Phytophthora palmivora]|uniref:Uncharacterized protein n=1 Tax=Phytophthora palmivora TaxID=4796 RepID=A0A2P4YPQ2_9STRA|nr:Hypothetical protein PHPALM_2485 [Phytophthora palmivora]
MLRQSSQSKPISYLERIDAIPELTQLKSALGGSRNSAVNTPMELMSLTTKSVQISTKDLKVPWLTRLRGSLTTRSKPMGYFDRIDAISKLTNLVA